MRAFIFLAGAVALFGATPTAAQEVVPDVTYGLCLDSSGCNDFFVTAKSVNVDTYDLTGYEYGCGLSDRIATGALRVDLGVAYVGINISSLFNDFAGISTRNYQLNLGSWSGPMTYLHTFIEGGVFKAHGGTKPVDLFVCSDPMGVHRAPDPDDSVRGG